MPDIDEIRLLAATVTESIRRLTAKQDDHCTARENAEFPGQTELQELCNQAEALKEQLRGMKDKSKVDPEVLEIERKLDDALNRSYWFWQKCKCNMAEEHH